MSEVVGGVTVLLLTTCGIHFTDERDVKAPNFKTYVFRLPFPTQQLFLPRYVLFLILISLLLKTSVLEDVQKKIMAFYKIIPLVPI